MPEVFEPEKRRQLFLDFDLAILTKFEPEKTGPFNRSHYMASKLGRLVLAHLLGLRDSVLPTARALAAWMEAQPHPAEGKDSDGCYDVYQWWQTLGLCKWLVDGDPAVAEFARASEADWRQWDKFDRFELNGQKLMMREGLELSLPLNLAARRYDVGLTLCREAGLTTKASSAPAITTAAPARAAASAIARPRPEPAPVTTMACPETGLSLPRMISPAAIRPAPGASNLGFQRPFVRPVPPPFAAKLFALDVQSQKIQQPYDSYRVRRRLQVIPHRINDSGGESHHH